ncbi:MAG: hypothetical protein LBL30_03855 [Holosporales bacterium]|jgi:UDPglucose 6-dehydrogenase|nr:hypothetical protein [Holosporales bacterium]
MDSSKPTALTIGFVGASHLAYVSAVAAAEKGSGEFRVFCYAQKHSFESIKEPSLTELAQKNKDRLVFTSSAADLGQCDIVYLAIDVPTNDQGGSDTSVITESFLNIRDRLNEGCLLVILSQVLPGYTRALDFDKSRLFYQVETLIFGKAVERALYPERFIVGAQDRVKQLPAILGEYLERYSCPRFIMNYESAEFAKISINMYLTATVTTTNMLASVCENIGASWSDIAETLRLDKRIGPYAYLKPGLGIAGGNLERDMATVKRLAYEHGCLVKMLEAQIDDSSYRSFWPLRKFKELTGSKKASVGVLGLSYKENTHSIKNSASVKFINTINGYYTVKAFDPVVKSIPNLDSQSIMETGQQVIDSSDFLAILTPWPEFSELDYSKFKGDILDPYAVIKTKPKSAAVYTLGEVLC